MESDDITALAVARAVEKLAKRVTDSTDDSSAYARVKDHCIALYRDTDATKFDAKINGKKVGTISVRTKKPGTVELVVDNHIDFGHWCVDQGLVNVTQTMKARALDYLKKTGVLPDGCSVHKSDETDEVPVGITFRIESPEKVNKALHDTLTDNIAACLED